MASLYDLTQDMLYLQGLLEEGEIDEQVYLDSVEAMCVEGKIENICKFVKNLEYKAAAYKAEIDRMSARKKTIENSISRLKESMLAHMVTVGQKKVEAGVFTVSVGHSKSVRVWDETMLPEQYLIPQPCKVDKTAISKALKAGEEVAGAEFVESSYLTMR